MVALTDHLDDQLEVAPEGGAKDGNGYGATKHHTVFQLAR